MSRSLARIALVAALMVGVIAMHSFGHRGHTEESGSGAESAVVLVHHHSAHGPEGRAAGDEQVRRGAVALAGSDGTPPAHGAVATAAEPGSDEVAPAHGFAAAATEPDSAEVAPALGSVAAIAEHGSDRSAAQKEAAESAPCHCSAAPRHRPVEPVLPHGSAATAPLHGLVEPIADGSVEAALAHGPVKPALTHGSAATAPDHDPTSEHDPLHALSMLGFMICGGVLLRVAFEILRKFWPRLLEVLAALTVLPALRSARTRFRYPPPLLRPTSLLLNRIAVLRI
jgi:hypothetical protein